MGYRPQIPVLCPQLILLNSPGNKIPGYATGEMILTAKPTCSETNLTQYHFNTHSTWNFPSNPGFRGESSASNRLCPRHGHAIQNSVEFFLLLFYELSCIFCLVAFRSEYLNIPIITCAMYVGERKFRGLSCTSIRFPENVREQQ